MIDKNIDAEENDSRRKKLLEAFSQPLFPQYRKKVNGEMKLLEEGDNPSNCEIVKIDYTPEYRAEFERILENAKK